MKRKKTKWYILVGLLLLLGGGLFSQRENIKAGLLFLRYSSDDLSEKMAQNEARMEDVLSKEPALTLRPLSEQERQMLQEGTLSSEEAVKRMMEEERVTVPLAMDAPEQEPTQAKPLGQDVQEPLAASDQTEQEDLQEVLGAESADEGKIAVNAGQEQQSARQAKTDSGNTSIGSGKTMPTKKESGSTQDPYEAQYARISELIAQVYVMRDTYVAKIEAIKTAAIAEYTALSEQERSEAKKSALLLRCMEEVTTLEATCDAKMDEILAELSALLREVNGDMSIVADVKAAYAEEKALKKAYYMNLYS